MWRIAISAVLASAAASAAEMCAVVNPQSAVDRAFIVAVEASKVAHSHPKHEWLCFSEADASAVSSIRDRVHAANPQACATFAEPSQASQVESQLAVASTPSWRETPTRLCYLTRDAAEVEKAVRRTVARAKGK